MRSANGLAGATVDDTAVDVDNFQCQRLGNDPRYCHAEKKTLFPSRVFKQPMAAVKGVVEAAAKEIGKLNEGRKILQEWLGEGALPVSQDEAQKRADQCFNCPLNRVGLTATSVAAEVVKRHVESKQSENLIVEGEEKLGVCTGCGCYLPLKVHVPKQYLTLNNETKTAIEQAVPDCWQLKENPA